MPRGRWPSAAASLVAATRQERTLLHPAGLEEDGQMDKVRQLEHIVDDLRRQREG